MLKKALKIIENDLLYSKKKVKIYSDDNDRYPHYTTMNMTARNKTDQNLMERIEKFQDQLKNEYVYRIPLKYLCDVGLVNQYFKFNKKIYSNARNRHAKIISDKYKSNSRCVM